MVFDDDIPTSPLVSILYRKQTSHLNNKLKDVNLSSGLHPLLVKTYIMGEVSQEELAASIHVNESTVTRNLDKLEKKGLIKKTPQKRKKIISVTGEGTGIAQKVMDYDEEWDEIIKDTLTDEEFESFRKLLLKICEELI